MLSRHASGMFPVSKRMGLSSAIPVPMGWSGMGSIASSSPVTMPPVTRELTVFPLIKAELIIFLKIKSFDPVWSKVKGDWHDF